MLVVTGWNSAITQALLPMLPVEERAFRADAYAVATDAARYVFCAGVIRPKAPCRQSDEEAAETFLANCVSVIRACDAIIDQNPEARICVIGSESGFSWSFDGVYAAAKAGLHRYVETKRLKFPGQQLVCIAPGIIGDAGMTLRREDRGTLENRAALHPKGRLLSAAEVARWIHFLLYVDQGYASGIVIRLNGGDIPR